MKMRAYRILAILVLLSSGTATIADHTKTVADPTNHDRDYSSKGHYNLAKNLTEIKKIVYAQRHDYDWTQKAWTVNDKSYLLIEANVDKAITQGQKPDSILAQYRSTALAHSDDTKALFRWGYAAYRAASQVELSPAKAYLRFETPGSIYSVQSFMVKNYVPSYRYARILFLLSNFGAIDSQTQKLGERLLQHNPSDKDVKYDMLALSSWDSHPSVRQQALRDIKQLAHQGSPEGSWLLAGIYERMLNVSKMPHPDIVTTQPIADNLVAALTKYVQLAPPQSGKRELAQKRIAEIRKDQTAIADGTYH